MRFPVAVAAVVLGLGAAQPVLADDVSTQIDAARTAYGRGDALHTLSALQAAVNILNTRLSDQFGKLMPPPLPGWEATAAESQSLDTIGGGLTVTRGYTKGEGTLNASLIVDNPAVGGAVAMLQSAPQVATQPGWSRVRVGNEDALLRYDPATRAGEIVLVIGDRILLQIEGNEITANDVLVDLAKGWNTMAMRKILGAAS